MKRRELESRLWRLNWQLVREGGPHSIFGKGEKSLAVPRHREINEHTARAILRAARRGEWMRIRGRVFSSGSWWAIEVPVLDVFTQGRTKREACARLKDAIEELADQNGFEVQIFAGRGETIEVSASDDAALTAFFLRRYREVHGVSLAEAAKRLCSTSKNAYARYERGTAIPTLEKMAALVRAVSPNRDLVLSESEINAPRNRG